MNCFAKKLPIYTIVYQDERFKVVYQNLCMSLQAKIYNRIFTAQHPNLPI